MNRTLWTLVLVAACGSNNSNHGMLIDASGDHPDASKSVDAAPPGPNMVKLTNYGSTPDYLAYRDGSGAWATPTMNNDGTYEISVHDAYEVVAVCTTPGGGLDENEVAATYSGDGPQGYFDCVGGSTQVPPSTVVVSGQMTQAGNVQMGDTGTSATGPWTFMLNDAPGTYDLVAIDSTGMVLQRGLVVTVAETLPTINVATTGSALTDDPITVTGAVAGDTVTSAVDLYTQNGFATIATGTATDVKLAPASLLTNQDFEIVAITAINTTAYRFSESYDPTVTAFPLLPVLSGVTFTDSSVEAGWTTLAVQGDVELYLGTGDETATSVDANVSASQSWLTANSATSIAFDNSAPGWQPAWTFWTTGSYFASLSISVNSQTGYAYTSLSETPTAAVAKRVAKRAREVRRHRR